MFARGLFAKDPETCRIRNERAKASDPVGDALAGYRTLVFYP